MMAGNLMVIIYVTLPGVHQLMSDIRQMYAIYYILW
jgi:hypothetical protein